MPDDNDQLKAVLFSDPKLQSQAVELLVNKRPFGWGRRSVAPYFNEHYGAQAKAVLDDMLKTRKDQCFYYDFFLKKFGISKATLYQRVHQSIRYVLERMDDKEHTYARLYSMLEVKRQHGVGVVLRFRPDCREGDVQDFKPKPVDSREDAPEWKDKMDAWLESATPDDAPFYKEGLALTSSEIKNLEDSLAGLSGIIFSITSYSIKIVKVNL